MVEKATVRIEAEAVDYAQLDKNTRNVDSAVQNALNGQPAPTSSALNRVKLPDEVKTLLLAFSHKRHAETKDAEVEKFPTRANFEHPAIAEAHGARANAERLQKKAKVIFERENG
jgi:hypothetical protein